VDHADDKADSGVREAGHADRPRGRWRLVKPVPSTAVPLLLGFDDLEQLTYLTRPEEDTPPYEELGSYTVDNDRLELVTDFFSSGSRTFRFTLTSDSLILDGIFEYIPEARMVADTRRQPDSGPPKRVPDPVSKPAVAKSQPADPEARAEQMTKRLIGTYELQGANPRIRLPRFLQFDEEGALRYVATPDSQRPREMMTGEFEVSVDDGSLLLTCDWFEGGSRRFSGAGFRPDGKSLTSAGGYSRFTLDARYEYRRLTPAEFAAARASEAGPEESPSQPEVLTAIKRLKAGERLALALTGDLVPGAPDQARYVRFGQPVGAAEHVVFPAVLDRGKVDRRDEQGPEGLIGGEFGRLTVLLRTGTPVPDGPARGLLPEFQPTLLETPLPRRSRWIASLTTQDSDTHLLSVDKNGFVVTSGLVEETGRDTQPLLVSIAKQTRSTDPPFQIVAIARDSVTVANRKSRPIDALRFPEYNSAEQMVRFLTTTPAIEEVENSIGSETYRFNTVASLPGMRPGEEVVEILEWRRTGGNVAFRARLRGTDVTDATDEGLWCRNVSGQREPWRLVLREGATPPDFVTVSPRIVDPRILDVATDRILVHCRLRTAEETEPGGGALIVAWKDLDLVSHVWGSASTDNRNLTVEKFFRSETGEVWAHVRSHGARNANLDGLITICNLADYDSAAKARSRPIAERVAEGNQPPPHVQQMLKSTKPRGPNPPPIYWHLGLEQVPAEARRLTRGHIGKVASHAVFVQFLNPKDANSRLAPKLIETDCFCRIGDPAPGRPQGTALTAILDFDGRWLMGRIGSTQDDVACWEVEKVVRSNSSGTVSTTSALVLVASVGQTIEVRPGDRRRIRRVDLDPRHGVCPNHGGILELPELIVFRLEFEDGTEGIFVQRTSTGEFIPPEKRPAGAGAR